MASPPMPAPTMNAAGRLRPGRLFGSSCSADSSGMSAGTSDFKQFGFLMLEQFVHLCDVSVGEVVEFPLRPVHFVFTRVAALDELVQRVLRVPADVADRDPAVLGLVAGDLDVFPAPFLGGFRADEPVGGPVIGRVRAP